MNELPYNLITVLGPTATGKTRFAVNLAGRLNGEIISADSRQVYRRMDIGTGKDLNEYFFEGNPVPVHLINIVDPGYEYNVYEYQADFIHAYSGIRSRGRMPVLCGGSGLYLEAVLKGYRLINVPINDGLRKEMEDKTTRELTDMLTSLRRIHNVTDTVSRKRLIRAIEIEDWSRQHPVDQKDYPVLRPFTIGIAGDRETGRQRITARLNERLDKGMVNEVAGLIHEGISIEKLIYYGLEYKYIALYLKGDMDYGQMVSLLNTAIHQFAKRQMTWFRRMERNGMKIHWLDTDLKDELKITKALEWFENPATFITEDPSE